MRIKGFSLAPKALINERKPILFMYRETPDNQYDTGWRFFSGYESDDYVNNPNNIGLYDIETIVRMHPDISPYLLLPEGSVLERNNDSAQFTFCMP